MKSIQIDLSCAGESDCDRAAGWRWGRGSEASRRLVVEVGRRGGGAEVRSAIE